MYANVGELSSEWQQLLTEIEEQEGILTEAQHTRMNQLEGELSSVISNLAGAIGYYEAQSKIVDAEIERLETRKLVYNNKASNLRKFLLDLVLRFSNTKTKTGSRQYKTPLLTLTEKVSSSVQIEDKELIPETYQVKRISYEISKSLIKEHIERGEEVPGAKIITNTTLTIK